MMQSPKRKLDYPKMKSLHPKLKTVSSNKSKNNDNCTLMNSTETTQIDKDKLSKLENNLVASVEDSTDKTIEDHKDEPHPDTLTTDMDKRQANTNKVPPNSPTDNTLATEIGKLSLEVSGKTKPVHDEEIVQHKTDQITSDQSQIPTQPYQCERNHEKVPNEVHDEKVVKPQIDDNTIDQSEKPTALNYRHEVNHENDFNENHDEELQSEQNYCQDNAQLHDCKCNQMMYLDQLMNYVIETLHLTADLQQQALYSISSRQKNRRRFYNHYHPSTYDGRNHYNYRQ